MRRYKTLKNILLIDDDEATNFLSEFTINKTQLQVSIEKVYNAQEGLDYLCCKGKYEYQPNCNLPQLIFLDINMPGLDGWDFLETYQQIKEEFSLNPIIIILTTSRNPDDKLKAKQYQDIKGFVHKPLTEDNVISIVKQYFEE